MTTILLNQVVPDFTLPATGEQKISLSDFRGKNIVLYFYPKDCTPGCTREGEDFRDHFTQFHQLQTVVLGASADTLQLHEKFKANHKLPFPLLSDVQETLCQQFGVIKNKNRYGRMVRGIERSTFLIDKNGVLRKEWRNVKVDRHVQAVLEAAKSLT